MQIELKIELDLPDEWQDWTDEEISQVLQDEYIGGITLYHLLEAQKAYKRKISQLINTNDHVLATAILNNHKKWAGICEGALFDFKKID